jgi:hypothetical protein
MDAGVDDPELAERLRVWDTGWRGFGQVTAFRTAQPELDTTPLPPPFAWQEQVQVATARSIHAAGWFRDLPVDLRTRPEVQLRMHVALGDMEAAVAGNAAFLGSLDRDAIRRHAATLRAHPEIATRLQARMHAGGIAAGIPKRLRDRLVSSQEAAWERLLGDHPEALVDEQLRLVRRVTERRGEGVALRRAVAAELQCAARWQAPGADDTIVLVGLGAADDRWRRPVLDARAPARPWRGPRGAARGLLKSSAVMFGCSLTAAGVALLSAPTLTAAVLLTGAVVMGLVSLGLLLAGLVTWVAQR